jgi:hypothetical protein
MVRLTLFSAAALMITALVGCARPVAADPMPDAKVAAQIRESLMAKAAGASTETKAAAKATGWGSIKGRFVLDGPRPEQKTLTVSKDAEVCGKHPIPNESIVVDSGGGLANVVVYARDRKIQVNPGYAESANAKVTLDNHDCHFEPHVVAMRAGQTLIVKNSDPQPVSHNTNAGLQNAPFNVVISPNTQIEKKIDAPESSPAVVTCNIHPWMKGYLVVSPHPYVAVSAKDGTFEIKNLPAGIAVELQAWHEASTAGGNAVSASRSDLKWQPNGRFVVTLEPDQTLDLKDIKVPGGSLAAQ